MTGYKSSKYKAEIGIGARYLREITHPRWVVVKTMSG